MGRGHASAIGPRRHTHAVKHQGRELNWIIDMMTSYCIISCLRFTCATCVRMCSLGVLRVQGRVLCPFVGLHSHLHPTFSR